MIISHFPGGGSAEKQTGLPEFTYTGSAQVVDDGNDNWRIKFLTSGTFKVMSNRIVQIFAVGGGGGGRPSKGGGGGGGYTGMIASAEIQKGTEYVVTVGAGGSESTNGGASSFGELLTVNGGYAGDKDQNGGNGGSGGGVGYAATGGPGGSDGGDAPSHGGATPGKGQGTTTREFAETSGTLYAGGGGGGGASGATVEGGAGGGGRGGFAANSNPPGNGEENTGGGGGGGYNVGASGGSGIIVIRNVRY